MNDRYLKGVLTVIAASLVWIAVQLTIGTAHAQQQPMVQPLPQPLPQRGMSEVRLVTYQGRREGDVNHPLNYVPVFCANCK
jgi:hypothetical protein